MLFKIKHSFFILENCNDYFYRARFVFWLMKLFFTFLFTILFLSAKTQGQNVPDYSPYQKMTPAELQAYRQSIWDTLPAAVGWVNDFEGLYTMEQEKNLERIVEHFEKKTTIEIAIVTMDSNMVALDKFDEFAYRVLKKWGIGKISKSNGIVICISKDYRRLFVCTDFGIDRYVNNYDKYKIIKKNFLPSFEKNNYYDGTLNGLTALLEKIDKDWKKDNTD